MLIGIVYILIYVTWVYYCELKWWYGMNWWIISEYWWCDCYVNWLLRNDELKWMWKTWFGNVIDFVFVVENDVIVEDVELRNEILNNVDDERLSWDIEIVELKFVEFDWIDELCELLVFDGNELIV